MKRLMCIVVSATLLFLLTGCGEKITGKNSGGTSMPKTNYLETKEEIEEFANSDEAPVGFIRPDDLAIIGKPEQKAGHYGYPYKDFVMDFCDANGVKIQIDLTYGKNYTPYKVQTFYCFDS